MAPSFRSIVVSTLVRAVAYAAIATPASAHTYEYCRGDVTSFMQSCSFDALAQCQAMSSGRGGDCYRDPSLGNASSSYAYAPDGGRARIGPAKNK
jgi:hypothetical protein